MRPTLKTTTSLIASLALLLPVPMAVQAQEAIMCQDGSEPPCPEGDPANALLEAQAKEKAAAEAAAAATAAAEAEAAAAAEAAAEAEATAAAAAEAAAEAEATAAAEAEAAAAAEAEAAAAAEAEAAAAEAEEPVAETAPEVEPTPEPATNAAPEAEALEPANEETLAKELEKALAETAAEPAPETEPTVAAEEAASGEAPEAAALEAAFLEPEAALEAAGADVVEEVVTEEAARSSAQDFSTNVAGVERAGAKKKSGLSDFEKVLLLGVGAVVVGAIISNNRKVELNSGDRVVVSRDDGSYEILKDDDALLRQPGSTVRTRTFDDGSTLTTVTRADGTQIVTIRDPNGRVLRRTHIDRDGYQTVLIDDTYEYEPVVIRDLPRPEVRPDYTSAADDDALREALLRETDYDQTFSLAQVRNIREVRDLVPLIDLDAVTFDSGSAAIQPDQARSLAKLGTAITEMIAGNPREVFLIEGHTDAVGSAAANLALSDRRAESVALALTEYFGVPPENLVVQGYGEQFLRINTQADERANRRAGVRRITDLLRSAAAN